MKSVVKILTAACVHLSIGAEALKIKADGEPEVKPNNASEDFRETSSFKTFVSFAEDLAKDLAMAKSKSGSTGDLSREEITQVLSREEITQVVEKLVTSQSSRLPVKFADKVPCVPTLAQGKPPQLYDADPWHKYVPSWHNVVKIIVEEICLPKDD